MELNYQRTYGYVTQSHTEYFSAYENQLEKTPQPLKNRKAIYAIAHCRTGKPKEFIRRVLDHVSPLGVHTIRYYGLYAPAVKAKHAIGKEAVVLVAAIGWWSQRNYATLF